MNMILLTLDEPLRCLINEASQGGYEKSKSSMSIRDERGEIIDADHADSEQEVINQTNLPGKPDRTICWLS